MVMAIADANAFETVLKRDLARSCPLTVGLNADTRPFRLDPGSEL